MCEKIQHGIGERSFSMAGIFSVEQLVATISESPLLISVNTGTAHIAAATQTPVIVLYALTNPQHTPWQVASTVLFFSVKEDLRSKNEVVNYVSQHLMDKTLDYPAPSKILQEAKKLLQTVEHLSRF
jgi:ADP-heptose:LPS heptosyltransferase